MAICQKCHTFFCQASMSGPREECECGGCYTRQDLRDEEPDEREPDDDQMEAFRARMRARDTHTDW
jgi:hypothetical protein